MINIYLSLPFLELSSPFGTVISIIRAVIAIIRTVIPSNLSSRDARAKVVEGPGSLPAQLGFLVYLASRYTRKPDPSACPHRASAARDGARDDKRIGGGFSQEMTVARDGSIRDGSIKTLDPSNRLHWSVARETVRWIHSAHG